jgi:hypothetical protein
MKNFERVSRLERITVNLEFFLLPSMNRQREMRKPKDCNSMRKRFVSSSSVIQELYEFFNYSQRRIMHKKDSSVLEWLKSFMTTSTTSKESKKDLSILLEWFKSLMTYSATPKVLWSRNICGFFMSDSRAWMTSSTAPEELHWRKNCGFFLSDSQASLLLQPLPRNWVQERFLGSSWVIQELHYFFNYSKRRIVFKNPATSLRGHHQLLLVTWQIPFYKELSHNPSVRLIVEPEKNKSPQQQITAIPLCRGKANQHTHALQGFKHVQTRKNPSLQLQSFCCLQAPSKSPCLLHPLKEML